MLQTLGDQLLVVSSCWSCDSIYAHIIVLACHRCHPGGGDTGPESGLVALLSNATSCTPVSDGRETKFKIGVIRRISVSNLLPLMESAHVIGE